MVKNLLQLQPLQRKTLKMFLPPAQQLLSGEGMQVELRKRAALKRQGKTVFPSSSAELWKGVLGHDFPTFLEEARLVLHLFSEGALIQRGQL